MADAKSFLGTGWSFPPVFSPANRGAVMVSDEEDIRQSLVILFSTNPGERVMQPGYGCPLRSLMFQPLDEGTLTVMRDMVRKAVLFYEPRIDLDSVDVDPERALEGVLMVRLAYRVRSTNSRSNMVYPFHFLEATDLVR